MIWPDDTPDLLEGVTWSCLSSAPDSLDGPWDLPGPDDTRWLPATAPGTAASAIGSAGSAGMDPPDLEAFDWWFRAPLPDRRDRSCVLHLGGLATLADVWVGDHHVLHSENMFRAHDVLVEVPAGGGWLTIRCASPTAWLTRRRPRPRWKCRDLVHPGYRWLRTSLIGRTTGGVAAPVPVGPWRPVTLRERSGPRVVASELRVDTDVERRRGIVELDAVVAGSVGAHPFSVDIGGHSSDLTVTPEGDCLRLRATVEIDDVRLWWPATHGDQPLYPVVLHVGPVTLSLGAVGFRTIAVDRTDGAFTLRVNGTPVFARGATWVPPDLTSPHTPRSDLERRLRQWREANLNLVRVAAVGVYESADFSDLCDELGLLVWQDAMFAFYDIPTTPEFRQEVGEEMRQVLHGWQGRPSLAVVCGASENEQQAEYLGLAPDSWRNVVTAEDLPRLVEEVVPGTVYVRTTPDGSPLPSQVNAGPTHYFGVGGYLRPLDDVRRSGVRFASECLPFATPPEPTDDPRRARLLDGMGHTPEWKHAVHRDAATAWDLEDVRNWYTTTVFGTRIDDVRRYDTQRALDLARATSAVVFEATLGEWRRPGSTCHGAVVLQGHDVAYGAGLGLVDSDGRPKATWWVMRRLMQPVVVLLTDEGVNGLGLHVSNDSRVDFTGQVRLDLVTDGQHVVESATAHVHTPAGGGVSVDTGLLFGSFRDLSWAHRFGPPAYDAVVATLLSDDGATVSTAHFLPSPTLLRTPERDLGLQARIEQTAQGPVVHLSTERLALWVALEVEDWLAEDSWFHLAPGVTRSVRLTSQTEAAPSPPRVSVRAFNCSARTRAVVAS